LERLTLNLFAILPSSNSSPTRTPLEKTILALAILLVLVGFPAPRLAAQLLPPVATTPAPAAVHGTIADANGIAVAGATVTLTNESTHATESTKTDNNGVYQFSKAKEGGPYTISVSSFGYPSFKTAEFTLAGLENAERDARLEPKAPFLATIERDWHNDILLMVEDRLPKVLVVFVFLFILERIVQFFVNRMRRIASHERFDPFRAAQLRTMASIIRATSYSVLGFLAFLQVLRLLNINYAPLLASAGIVGVGVGLAAQSLFKDIINGIFILVEDQYNVGETVKIASLTGTVEDLTLRLTRLRDGDGTLYIIPNSQVATVSNLSRDFAVATLAVSVDASADPSRVLSLLTEIAKDVRADATFKDGMMADPSVSGVDNINGRALTYSISARVRIAQKDDVLRAFRNRTVDTFRREHIPLGIDPANLLLLQQQKAADPTAPPAQQPLIPS
jgi:moderate conductance mechanosensitive channel